MDNASDLVLALRPVLVELDRMGVRYCVGGSVASSVHGASRSTMDVDLAAELTEAHATELVKSLSGEFYASEDAAQDAVRRKSCFNLIHLATSFKVDVFVSQQRPFDRSVQQRAISDQLGVGDLLSARIATAEDIILIKLEWYRLGGAISDRQWNDVLRVAKLYGECLDRDYLRKWADQLSVRDLLDRILVEVDSR